MRTAQWLPSIRVVELRMLRRRVSEGERGSDARAHAPPPRRASRLGGNDLGNAARSGFETQALLQSGLTHGSSEVRLGMVAALGEHLVAMAAEGHTALAAECVARLASTPLNDAHTQVRLRAAGVLGEAAQSLVGLGDPGRDLPRGCVHALVRLSEDPAMHVRRAAVDALGDVGIGVLPEREDLAQECVEGLGSTGFSVGARETVRRRVVETIGRLATVSPHWDAFNVTAECIRLLSNLLRDRLFSIRVQAARSLGLLTSALASKRTTRCYSLVIAVVRVLTDHLLEDFVGRSGRLAPRSHRMVLDIIGRVAVRMVVSKFDRLARVAIDSLIAAARTYDCETARAHAVRLIGQVATHAHFMNSRVEEYCASFLARSGRRGFVRRAAAKALQKLEAFAHTRSPSSCHHALTPRSKS